jgi:hypothetical protein
MNHMKLLLLSFLALTVAIGCKKAQPTETAPAPENASTPAPPPPANGNSLPLANQPTPSQAPAVPTVDTTKAFSDVNAALKARDYQKATETLLAIQQKALTEQQAAAARAQMVQLQGAVASGVASGDPNAKAAADQLRASAKRP